VALAPFPWSVPGNPHAAQKSLTETHKISLEDIAKTLLEEGTQPGMERAVERINAEFKDRAPRVTGEYADSTLRLVVDNGTPVFVSRGARYGKEPGQ
jgi:hypothetical protein